MQDLNKRIAIVFTVFAALMSLIVLNLTYVQILAPDSIADKPQNYRIALDEMSTERGEIITSDGVIVAKSEKAGDTFKRVYPYGPVYAPVSGFLSARFGRSCIEDALNDELTSQTPRDQVNNFFSILTGKKIPGNDVFLTINSKVQRTAVVALGKRRGAVVAIEPETGAVLALASFPTFNPNTVDKQWSKLAGSAYSPLLNRATQGRYVPGSAFKLISAATAISLGITKPPSRFVDVGKWKVGGATVVNYGGEIFGEHDFIEALTFSINTTFAKVGVEIGAPRLVEFTNRFGFNETIPLEIATKESFIPSPGEMDQAELAWTAVGQGKLLATPLEMALVASSIANGGAMQKPFLVKEVRSKSGYVVERTEPVVWKTPIDSDVADALSKMMDHVVEEGTGQAAAIHGVVVAGKTGTAQLSEKGKSNAWFVGFAPADAPKIAVAVLVEQSTGTGGRVAAPIAKKVMQAVVNE